MSYQNEALLQKLLLKIESLTTIVEQYSHIKLNEPCFNEQLFQHQAAQTNYAAYLTEIKDNFQKLSQLIYKQSNNHYLDQVDYLATLVINQIIALQRELATHELRTHHTTFNHETLHEKYAKNLEYLRRLENMKYEQEQRPNDIFNRNQLQIIEQRIQRCKYAISLIEQKMEST